MNIFKLVAHEVATAFKKVFSHDTLVKAQQLGQEVEALLPTALAALQSVEGLIGPNKNIDKVIALGEKLGRHLTPEVLADETTFAGLLQDAAVKEVLTVIPAAKQTAVREAIALAMRFYKADKVA